MTTYKELMAQANELMRQAEEARQQEVAGVIKEIRATMAEYGISVDDLRTGEKKRASGKSAAIAYRNPATGETWSGRGRAPRWLTDAVAAGKPKESFKA